jgi:Tol biopolymer transport system component
MSSPARLAPLVKFVVRSLGSVPIGISPADAYAGARNPNSRAGGVPTKGRRRRTGRRALSTVVALGLGFAGVGVPSPAGALGAPTTSLESRAPGLAGAKANGSTGNTSISADGRFVAFQSSATNLSPADGDTTVDIFVRDRRTGANTLVSRATGATGAKGNQTSDDPAISADGRWVAFRSRATTLDPADADDNADIYVRDLVANKTTLVSRATGAAGVKSDFGGDNPTISGDGRMVSFVSQATNIDPADTHSAHDVYVRDVVANTTSLVSRAAGANGAKGNGGGGSGAISADGRRVAFISTSTNIHPADTDTWEDVYVRDLVANTLTLASRGNGVSGTKANDMSFLDRRALSADGTRVAFATFATNLHPFDADAVSDVYVRDLVAGTTTLATRTSGPHGGKALGPTYQAAISADGRRVAFTSAANLDPADTDGFRDVYVRDLVADTTVLASRATGASGAKGSDDTNGPPSLSGDGRYVSFGTFARLDPADQDDAIDSYVRTLALPEVTGVAPPTLRRGETRTVTVTGSDFTATPEVAFGAGVSVTKVSLVSSGRLDVTVAVAPDAAFGARSVAVTNPAGDATVGQGFSVADPGYWLAARDGGVFAFNAPFSGSAGGTPLNQPIVAVAGDPDGRGYWFVAADGGVFAFDAGFYGSMGGARLNQPIVGMAATATGKGYWLVARDGGIFAFGDAVFAGSTGAITLNQPIVGMAADPDGRGYWLVARDGGVFAFDARFAGSTGAIALNRPIVGMAADRDRTGYWLVASDGGIFAFDAPFSGSTGAIALNQPIAGMAADPDGRGYWLVASDGGIFGFDAAFHGSAGGGQLNQPIVGMAAA